MKDEDKQELRVSIREIEIVEKVLLDYENLFQDNEELWLDKCSNQFQIIIHNLQTEITNRSQSTVIPTYNPEEVALYQKCDFVINETLGLLNEYYKFSYSDSSLPTKMQSLNQLKKSFDKDIFPELLGRPIHTEEKKRIEVKKAGNGDIKLLIAEIEHVNALLSVPQNAELFRDNKQLFLNKSYNTFPIIIDFLKKKPAIVNSEDKAFYQDCKRVMLNTRALLEQYNVLDKNRRSYFAQFNLSQGEIKQYLNELNIILNNDIFRDEERSEALDSSGITDRTDTTRSSRGNSFNSTGSDCEGQGNINQKQCTHNEGGGRFFHSVKNSEQSIKTNNEAITYTYQKSDLHRKGSST